MSRKTDTRTARCAIYCRVSTAGQAEGDFSSIDAQREAALNLVRSQATNGWEAIDPPYVDPGYSAATLNRPALQDLIADVEAGKIDVVVVYKLDRLSRSQRDLLDLLELFSRHGVDFKSVTQNFDTTGPMGRAMLGMLSVFSELERGLTSERTRDKVLAARRRGRWTGGLVPLGYDLRGGRLTVNEPEAERVRQIFDLYLEHRSLTRVAEILRERGWQTKSWTTNAGGLREGRPFSPDSLRRLLTSAFPAGRVRSGEQICEGEHEAIVSTETWEAAQEQIRENGKNGGCQHRNRSGALLKGLIRCKHCGTAMTPTSSKRGSKRYAYYTCVRAQKHGWASCPSKSVAAGTVDAAVVEQIRQVARDPALIERTVEAAQAEHHRQQERHEAEVRAVSAELAQLAQEEGRLAATAGQGGRAAQAAERRLEGLHRRRMELQSQLEALEDESGPEAPPDPDWLRETLASFEPVWEVLQLDERANVAQMLIAEVVYDGEAKDLEIQLVAGATGSEDGEEAA